MTCTREIVLFSIRQRVQFAAKVGFTTYFYSFCFMGEHGHRSLHMKKSLVQDQTKFNLQPASDVLIHGLLDLQPSIRSHILQNNIN